MGAGKYRHRVSFDEPVASQNETGEEIVDFVEARWSPVWGTIQPLAGRERLMADQVIAEGTTRIIIRWSPHAAQVNARWRARHGGVIYNISGPPAETDMSRREIEIIATSGVNAG